MDLNTEQLPSGETEQPPMPVGEAGDEQFNSVREAARQLSAWRQQKRQMQQQAEQTEEGAPSESETTGEETQPEPQQELAEEANPEPQEEAIGETEGESEPEAPAIEPPVSWSAEEKERFASLPRETQEYLATREKQRDAEVNRRQQEFAERMKGLEPEQHKLMQARAQYEQALPIVLQALESSNEFADIRSMDDVEQLARTDPERYSRWDAHDRKTKAIRAEMEQVQQRQWQEHQAQFSQWAAEQDRKFAEKVPEFADEKKAKELQELALSTLEKDYGFSPEEMQQGWQGQFRDYRMQQILLDAARYRQLKKNPPKPAAKPVPPVVRPGVAKSPHAGAEAQVRALEDKLNQTGSIKDAAALMAARRRLASR